MDPNDIGRWDAVRAYLRNEPIREVFLDFANLSSKQYMKHEPENWYRFCDGNYTETDFHKEWLDIVMDNQQVAIECSREHLKTSWVLNFILYHMWRIPNFSVIYFSATQGQAKDKLAEWEDLYDRNAHWLELDKSKETWSKFNKQFTNGSEIRAEGWGTAVEGAHVQLIVLDDILQEEGTGGMTDEETWKFYSKVVSPMSTESGRIILIGTKKRQGDIFDKISDNPEWEHRRYPSTPEDPIFPEKWPKERLESKRREMTPQSFDREFGLEVMLTEDALIPKSWNERNTDETISYATDGWKDGMTVCGVDPAISPTGDNAAFFCQALLQDGERLPLDIQQHKGMTINDMLMKMHSLDNKYDFDCIMIEKNSFQRIIVNEAIDRTSLPIQGHETTKVKSDAAEGVPRISVLFENGKYRYPYKTNQDVNKTEMVFKALNQLQYKNGKLTNDHTPDIVMAKYMSERALAKFESGTKGLDSPLVRGVKGGL